MTPTHFYDSAAPMNIPSGVYAAAYINGFAWNLAEMKRMSHIICISVHSDPSVAKYARVIDVETGAASPQDVPPFIRFREAHGHHDATAYVNRSNWQAVKFEVEKAGLHCRYWVATLDGTQDVAGAWAVQYQGGPTAPYDVSVLHGINDFRNTRRI